MDNPFGKHLTRKELASSDLLIDVSLVDGSEDLPSITSVWILSTSVTPQPVTTRGFWNDASNWSDANVWYD